MSQPIKYLSVVSKVLQLYQNQLISLFKKFSMNMQYNNNNQHHYNFTPDLLLFKNKLERELKILRDIEDQKAVLEDKISEVCQPMSQYLTTATRVKNTSQSERYVLRSSLRTQDTQRMRLTGGLRKHLHIQQAQPIHQSAEMDQIIRSYKIQEEIGPRMRMKWKSLKNSQQQKQQQRQKKAISNLTSRRVQRSTIGDNNIDLLSYTIPEIQNSIKRLSLQSGYAKNRSPEKIFENYRTIDTRGNNRKKYVPRLI